MSILLCLGVKRPFLHSFYGFGQVGRNVLPDWYSSYSNAAVQFVKVFYSIPNTWPMCSYPNKKTLNVRISFPGSVSALSKGYLCRPTPFSLFAFLEKFCPSNYVLVPRIPSSKFTLPKISSQPCFTFFFILTYIYVHCPSKIEGIDFPILAKV